MKRSVLKKPASDRMILASLIACVLLFTLTGIAWSAGAYVFTTALPFFILSIVMVVLIIHEVEKPDCTCR